MAGKEHIPSIRMDGNIGSDGWIGECTCGWSKWSDFKEVVEKALDKHVEEQPAI